MIINNNDMSEQLYKDPLRFVIELIVLRYYDCSIVQLHINYYDSLVIKYRETNGV